MRSHRPTCVLLLFLALLLGGSSCSKDVDDELSLLGNWIEESPVAERTQLYFHSGNRLTSTQADGNSQVYTYRFENENIVLWPQGQSEGAGSSTLFFRQIDSNTFQIENLYV